MTPVLTASSAGLIVFCILTEATRELCFKKAAHGENLRAAIFKPWTVAGIILWAIELVAWVRVLETVPLSIAFPLMALVYVLVLAGGAVFLQEKVSARHTLGALLITAGVALIGATGI